MFTTFKINDVGNDNFIVSRLMLELPEIIHFYFLEEEEKSSQSLINNIFDTANQIIICDKIYKVILDEVNTINEDIKYGKYRVEIHNDTINKPHIIDLKRNCQDFLYHAKSTLRDFTRVFELTHGKKFSKQSNIENISKILISEQGEDCNIARFLQSHNEKWIKNMVEMRNYVEHPYDGNIERELIIENFEIDIEHLQFVPPIWHFSYKGGIVIEDYILDTMNYFICNLVLFCENVTLMILEDKYSKNRIIGYIEKIINYTNNRDLKRFDF